MAEGRSRQLWGATSQVLAMLANGLLRIKDGKAFTPDQFNPHHDTPRRLRLPQTPEEARAESKDSFAMLKGVFVKQEVRPCP